jgi:sporulation protein YunB
LLRFRRWLARRRRAARLAGGVPHGRATLAPGLAVLLFALLAVVALAVLEASLAPTILLLAEAHVTNLAQEGVARVIQEHAAVTDYRRLMHLERDERGRIVVLLPNTTAINALAAATALDLQAELERLAATRVTIPLGQVMGSQIFADYGPRIPVRLVPIAVPLVRVNDAMEEAGINQTRHTLYMEVTVDMRVVVPLLSTRVELQNCFPVAQTVLLGEVPQTYVRLELPGGR